MLAGVVRYLPGPSAMGSNPSMVGRVPTVCHGLSVGLNVHDLAPKGNPVCVAGRPRICATHGAK